MKRPEHHSSPSLPRSSKYAESVPAVVHALDVIEYLEKIPTPATLSELSRALGISPSSLLAILRTLRGRGYLIRDDRTGGYRIGSDLATLNNVSGTDRLVRDAAAAVAALAQAVGSLASAASRDRRSDSYRALGVAGQHLSTALLGSETRAASGPPDSNVDLSTGGPITGDQLEEFLDGPWLATLSCVKADGYPHSVPVWYQWDGERFFIISRIRAEWVRHVDVNPRVSLTIGEPDPPFRRALVEGLAEPLIDPKSAEGARAIAARMAKRYLGLSSSSYVPASSEGHLYVFAVLPRKLVTWRGLASHPRYQKTESTPSNVETRSEVA